MNAKSSFPKYLFFLDISLLWHEKTIKHLEKRASIVSKNVKLDWKLPWMFQTTQRRWRHCTLRVTTSHEAIYYSTHFGRTCHQPRTFLPSTTNNNNIHSGAAEPQAPVYRLHFFRILIIREKRRILSHFSRKTKKKRKKIIPNRYLEIFLLTAKYIIINKFSGILRS